MRIQDPCAHVQEPNLHVLALCYHDTYGSPVNNFERSYSTASNPDKSLHVDDESSLGYEA